ncbi:uncharacterized protein MYCFIDRAFT_212850 [Pseudocercospora fijiensis CIRAD86]|uniref:Casein kinase II beta 2 subunit n=1 Tax=Pseudocercospora fijiensis (strain CIRAD86) TaxID=383855 RepID=N1Q5R4_PSEFD|nr:uncharacterized protein MYCFIDRAFT_212850 [Pseudocercospora fijiensis CIRAD86]EME87350.1 hypothetical protein MYCFIDRAFT_212850 [Pseudocercospora fijiensis CIRAD86]
MPPIAMHWHSLLARHAKSLKAAASKAIRALDVQLGGQRAPALELVRNTPKQPLHPLARIRQSQSRNYSTARRWLNSSIRQFSSVSGGKTGLRFDRSSFPKSQIGSFVQSSSGRAPFASTLRPNLTGGTLGRSAGGYAYGAGHGGKRFFSHGPAVQAQVVQNVSQAVRAFFISGQKAQFDGVDGHGNKRFKAVSALQDETGRKMRSVPKATPGSWIDFRINPTITALTSLNAMAGYDLSSSTDQADHLNTDGLLNVLSVDFSRSLKDLAAVLNDLKRLSALGDLPITYEGQNLRVHFPGCPAEVVERLCEELNVQRGTVVQDEAFDAFAGTEIALLFPFAPSNESSLTSESDGAEFFETKKAVKPYDPYVISLDDMLSDDESARYSTQSDTGFEDVLAIEDTQNPWLASPSLYQSVRTPSESYGSGHSPLEYQGFEGIYRFIEELDSARR